MRPLALVLALAGCVGEETLVSPDDEVDSAIDTATVAADSSLFVDSSPEAADDAATTGDTPIPPIEDTAPPDHPLPPIPAACTRTAHLFAFNPNGSDALADAFEANLSPCADYWIHVAAVPSDRTMPRAVEPAKIRARKGRFFAVAEFHFGAWSERTDPGWFEKGVEFRRRMDAAGYNVMRGDTWAINELPMNVRTDATVRANIRELTRGLYTGAPGSIARAGIVLVVNTGHDTSSLTSYKDALKTWIAESAFWSDMNKYVRFWGQETYTGANRVCVGSATVAERAERVNDFVMHPGRLATASGAPTTVLAARAFFGETYFALTSAAWKSAGAYGSTSISLDAMKHHVSLQLYASRLWSDSHAFPDGRVGVVWDELAGTPAERTELATRLAQSFRDAHEPGATAARACSPTGAYTWCDCTVAGATFNDVWKTFSTW